MVAALCLSRSYLLTFRYCRTHRKMKIKHPPSAKAVAFQPVPASDRNRGNSKIVRNGFDAVIFSDAIHSQTLGISLRITATLRRDRNYELCACFNTIGCRKLIRISNRFQRRMVGPRQRHQRLARRDCVVAPPDPHVWRDRTNCRLIFFPCACRQV